MPYVKSSIAEKHFGVCASTLRLWAQQEKIKYIRVGSGIRRYEIESCIPTKPKREQESFLFLFLLCDFSATKHAENFFGGVHDYLDLLCETLYILFIYYYIYI